MINSFTVNKCGIEQRIYNGSQTFGTITNVEDNVYFCEWLIKTESIHLKYINLKFMFVNLNCNIDTLYIFDGESFEDKLLISISGPFGVSIKPVFGSSGSLLIIHYSETKVLHSTFSLEYSISECPLNCSDHGFCRHNLCVCDELRTGDFCQYELCPNNCSQHGNCVQRSVKDSGCLIESEYFCDCQPNSIGESCNIKLKPKNENQHDFQWKILFSNEQIFSARASLASVYDPKTDNIFTYGGRNYEVIYSDLLAYSVSKNHWSNITNCDMITSINSTRPGKLWAHTLNIINDILILFGGISDVGIVSNELWIYNITENKWIQKETIGAIIPGLAFHVSVIVDHQWLYVHGGRFQNSTYSSNIYRINILNGLMKWQLIIPTNSKAHERQMAAHTAIFYGHLRSIVLFGGISWSTSKLTKLRNEIHLYNVDSNTWSILDLSDQIKTNSIPSKRAFHSMIIIEDYLLVFGGFTEHKRLNNSIECRDNRIYIYCLHCQKWIDPLNVIFPLEGIFSHTMVQWKNFVFVLGGYFDNVRNEIMIIEMPTNICHSNSCQSLCSRLTHCFNCLAYDFCQWDILNQKCGPINKNVTDYHKHRITKQNECKQVNIVQNGLTFLKYLSVANFSHPDEVSIMPKANFETSFNEEWSMDNENKIYCENDIMNCSNDQCKYDQQDLSSPTLFNMARILGFIHPLGAQSYHNNFVRIYLRSTSSNILYSSSNNQSSHSFKTIPSTSPLYNSFLEIPFDESTFFIDFIIKFPIRTVMNKLDYEKIDLSFNTINYNSSNDFKLMPFSDPNLCSLQSNCNSCLSNVACIWCPLSNQCMVRGNISQCKQEEEIPIIVEPNGCFHCFEAIFCSQCVLNPNCEWLNDYGVCVRRGRFNYSIQSTEFCPIECYQRRSFESCVNGSNNCMWCHSTNQCLHSSSHYPFSLFDYCHQDHSINNCTQINECPIGTFGNITIGCKPCNCNGHGDQSKGICDRETGICFCQDFTEGIHCERCISGYYGEPKHGGLCFIECQNKALITNATFGHFGSYIRDIHFSRHYPKKNSFSSNSNINCLWIITSEKVENIDQFEINNKKSNPMSIKIFRSMNLNCSHSTLIVYDGIPKLISVSNRTKSNILATICGKNNAQDMKLIANSGTATILYISNKLNQGFNASYSVVNQSFDLDSIINWPEHSHTLHYYDDHLIFIGGHVHTRHLSATLFSLKYRRWIVPEEQPKQRLPTNRYLHASTLIGNKLYVYGGLDLATKQVSNEFWCAFINHHHESLKFVWINLTRWNESTMYPMPHVVGHTLTTIKYIQQDAIILIGGFSPEDGFSQFQYIYFDAINEWHRIITKGPAPIGIVAHSSVYHEETNILYVFGGLDFKESHKMAISNTLYTLNMTSKVWHRIQSSVINSISPVYFHMWASAKNYMMIFGGKTHHNIETNETLAFAYYYKCNRWISLNNVSFWNDSIVLFNRRSHSKKSSVFYNGSIYFYETWSSRRRWSINTIHLPNDICNIYSYNKNLCLSMKGCSFCSKSSNGSEFCYDSHNVPPQNCPRESIIEGTKCLANDDCSRFTNCADCTANNYEIRDDGGCQWCADCHLANGQCIKINDSCQFDDDMNSYGETLCPNISLVDTKHCTSRRCLATDCHKCLLLNNHVSSLSNECIWTKQVYKFIRFGHAMPTNPIFDWACIESSIIKYTVMKNVPTIPPLDCPWRCSKHNSCFSCLEETTGDESGSHECIWSELTHECMSPTYTLLRCQQGNCGGFIYRRTQSQCPQECESFEKANDCLTMLHCGWCAINGLPIDGVGFCLKGGLFGPIDKTCSNKSVDLLSQLKYKPYYVPMTYLRTEWHYLYPPKENECLNGHHSCDRVSQECIDLDDGFMCRCKSNYKMFENICKPICQQGCTHGICIAPNVCRCHFGFIGDDCSIECQCHGHSTCPSAERLDECIECHNNTQGQSCQQCKPFFVGNPSASSSCQPCFHYCHNHTELCFSEEHLTNNSSLEMTKTMLFDDDQWIEFGLKMQHGPSDKTICVNCKNNTEGDRCDRCKLGFFKISDDIRDGCRRCMCNDHGSVCNPFNGENCNCHNNTENDRQCNYLNSKEYSNYINKTYFFKSSQIMTTYSLPCWMLQCSKCKDYFYGVPTNGHQCYRHMYIEKEYCLDPATQENCLHQPKPLLHGRTVFFGLQPRYMNVDIKLIIYSVDGKIDLYLSSKDDVFVVKVDPMNGIHHVHIDKKYIYIDEQNETVSKNITDRFILQQIEDFDPDDTFPLKSPYKFVIENLNEQISSYITMKSWYEIIILKNVRGRLEITIPYKSQDLRTTRYYIMIRGNYLYNSDTNYGFVVLRQDQSRIDLFIFFCVFLACFFMFLCLSLLFWRMKQIIDLHRVRQQQEIELEHMANRPFTKITILFDQEFDAFKRIPQTCHSLQCTPSKKVSFLRQLAIGFKESPKIYPENVGNIMNYCTDPVMNKTPTPVSIEPTFDGLAAIFTTFIKLPRKHRQSPIQIAAASSLVSIKNCPSISHKLSS